MAKKFTRRQSWTVVYRTGGTVNYAWHRSARTFSKEEARERAVDLEHRGYPSMVVDYDMSMAIGLPEGYAATTEENQ